MTDLRVLGQTVRHSVDTLDTFLAPPGCTGVTFICDELASMCPVTEQPDLSHVEITYVPAKLCIESKSLKLYLWSFRDRGVFAEAMAVEIAQRVREDAKPYSVHVALTQSVRGGIETTVVAEA
jgi:7-cyano-7-deazaguanine reductase